MTRVYLAVLGISFAITSCFGVAFLAAPARVFALGGMPWEPRLVSVSINLGSLVLLAAAVAAQAMRWIHLGRSAGFRLAHLLGGALFVMGALEAIHGIWLPAGVDGGRGVILLGLAWIGRVRGAVRSSQF
jgi:hypothetical protein